MSVSATGMPRGGILSYFLAGIDDAMSKRERCGISVCGVRGGRALDGALYILICAIFGVASFILFSLSTEPTGIQATLAPEVLSPIVGLAGLFGPDRSPPLRRREGETQDPDPEDSRPGVEEENPAEPVRVEKRSNIFARIRRIPGSLRRSGGPPVRRKHDRIAHADVADPPPLGKGCWPSDPWPAKAPPGPWMR